MERGVGLWCDVSNELLMAFFLFRLCLISMNSYFSVLVWQEQCDHAVKLYEAVAVAFVNNSSK